MGELALQIKDINLDDTFDCGQCFRWERQADGSYVGVVGDKVARLRKNGDNVIIKSNCDDSTFWAEYLDAKRDYYVIRRQISARNEMKRAVTRANGIRLLKQQMWECLASFIISQNNNIPRIKRIINALCEQFGTKIRYDGMNYYSFPDASDILGKDLSGIRSGFRAKYLQAAAERVCTDDCFLEGIADMPTDAARERLKEIKGVGDKIADCVLLFAYQKFDVFPKDVWIKRIMSEVFGVDGNEANEFARHEFGNYAGFAQQYLYHYYRGLASSETT